MDATKSADMFRRAQRVMVGGVSSPVRAFKAVGGEPLFIERGSGPKMWDVDGNVYIDYVLSWGPLILGHAHPEVTSAVANQIRKGTSFGAPTESELMLAEEISRSVSSIENVRFVNSGTEATMSALRLARAFTSRTRVVKFEGCYHGHADQFLTKAGSGLATFDLASSSGVPDSVISSSITLPFNDIAAAEKVLANDGADVAAIIVEPVAGNMGVVHPEKGFLSGLRRLANDNGSLLIFDEVITGFRVSRGGAQELFGVSPDITCLGKVIGGGFPVGAYGGRKEIMRLVAPEGPVYQAGTLSGNPVAMVAGLATLDKLTSRAYSTLEETSQSLEEGFTSAASNNSVQVSLNRVGSMVGLFFTDGPVRNFQDSKRSNIASYAKFHRSMLAQGHYLPPSPFETIFLSMAHTESDVSQTVRAASIAFKECA
ncbi:MAG TPA: glutamate-1-semialdehyde 2,1-aminomutase [Nitrososphaerales archaeon]|nr:glutamate-1-semialdehyde 2,1-aminomutase [Nitrososphaerales archaeon]